MAPATAITPVLRYRDAGTAARWLCEAFGFREHNRAQGLDGHVRYVSLRLGDSFVLIRPVANSVFDDLVVQPEAIGGANTQICYLTISDATAHRARAEAAGAKIEAEPQDDGLGGTFYTCRDLEGHLWMFGTHTYGSTHEVASAFDPVEMSPSLPNARIVFPPEHGARRPPGRLQLLREIGVASVTAVLVAGGLMYYDAGGIFREMAIAPAARIEETAANEAVRRLAEERTAMQRAQAELADMRRQKDEAVRALETAHGLSQKHLLARERAEAEVILAKSRIAESEAKLARAVRAATAKLQAPLADLQQINLRQKDELQEARTALLAANRTIGELRSALLAPMESDSEAVPDHSPCALAVQCKIALGYRGPIIWPTAKLDSLCRGAEASAEPAKCFEEIVRGKINWGAGTTWATSNALALCGGTHSARQTLDCFKTKIASDQPWRIAIRQCRAKR